MKKALGAILVASLIVFAMASEVRAESPSYQSYVMVVKPSEWVKHQIAWFERQLPPTKRVAYQRPHAWGGGLYDGQSVEWFAYSEIYGVMQFNISTKLSEAHLAKLRSLKDAYRRPWDARIEFAERPGAATWISTSNAWPDTACQNIGGLHKNCKSWKAIAPYLFELNKTTGVQLWAIKYFD